MSSRVPDGWKRRSLGEVATLQRGFDLPKRLRAEGIHPLVSSSGVIDTHNEGPIASPGVATGRSGSIGSVFFLKEAFWPLNTVLYVKDFHGNDARWVYYLLISIDLARFAGGMGVPTLNRNVVHKEAVLVPPLSEQRRIVSVLDAAFAGLATAEANTRQNLTNARELYESQLNAVFDSAPAHWTEDSLGNICEIARGGSPRPIKSYITTASDGVNWVKIGDATASEKYIYETKQKIKPAGVQRSRMVFDGDFLLSNSMSFGRPYIMRTNGAIHDGWLVLRDQGGVFDQDFLYLFLSSRFAFDQLDRMAAGSVVRNLNTESVRALRVRLPCKEEQEVVANTLGGIAGQSATLAKLAERKLAALAALKQSLLHRAFRGELSGGKAVNLTAELEV